MSVRRLEIGSGASCVCEFGPVDLKNSDKLWNYCQWAVILKSVYLPPSFCRGGGGGTLSVGGVEGLFSVGGGVAGFFL